MKFMTSFSKKNSSNSIGDRPSTASFTSKCFSTNASGVAQISNGNRPARLRCFVHLAVANDEAGLYFDTFFARLAGLAGLGVVYLLCSLASFCIFVGFIDLFYGLIGFVCFLNQLMIDVVIGHPSNSMMFVRCLMDC